MDQQDPRIEPPPAVAQDTETPPEIAEIRALLAEAESLLAALERRREERRATVST